MDLDALKVVSPRDWSILRQYGRYTSVGMFALALLTFVAPFATLSCGRAPLATATGWNLVAGVTVEASGSGQHIDPVGSAVIAFVATVFALPLVVGDRIWCRIGQVVLAGVGVVALLVLKADIDAQVARTVVLRVSWEPGYWLAMLAMLNGAAAAAVSMVAVIALQPASVAAVPTPSVVDRGDTAGRTTHA